MSRHVVSVNVVGAFLVVDGLQFVTAVVVRQDVREPVLGTVHGQVGRSAWLLPTHVLQLLELFAEPVHTPHHTLIFYTLYRIQGTKKDRTNLVKNVQIHVWTKLCEISFIYGQNLVR